MAVSDRQSGGVAEVGRPSQVVGEPPKLGIEGDVVCPNLATLFYYLVGLAKETQRCSETKLSANRRALYKSLDPTTVLHGDQTRHSRAWHKAGVRGVRGGGDGGWGRRSLLWK